MEVFTPELQQIWHIELQNMSKVMALDIPEVVDRLVLSTWNTVTTGWKLQEEKYR
jgi:hypothetical protein